MSYFLHVVVEGFANDFAVLAHDYGDARDRERAAGSGEAGIITNMGSGREPFDGQLIAVLNAIGDIDLQARDGLHADAFARHDGGTTNKGL